jgi:hypothetical protein
MHTHYLLIKSYGRPGGPNMETNELSRTMNQSKNRNYEVAVRQTPPQDPWPRG